MQGHIVMLIAFGYVLGLTIIGVLAYERNKNNG